MRAMILSTSLLAVALNALPLPAVAQSQGMPYCLETQAGTRTCVYESLDRCQQIARAPTSLGSRCVSNPALSGTTGAGGMDAARGSGPHSLDRLPAPVK